MVTKMEAEVLNLLAYDLYNQSNGSRPTEFNDVCGGIWTWSLSEGWPHAKKMLSGVVSSLVQKGLVWSHEKSANLQRGEPSDACVGMTQAGYEVWLTVDKNGATPAVEPEDDETRAKRVMAKLPEFFGLRSFPNQVFHLGYASTMGLNWVGRCSYTNDDQVLLYTANEKGQDFAKGTLAELELQIVPPPACGIGCGKHRGHDGPCAPMRRPDTDFLPAKPTKTFAIYADGAVVKTVKATSWLEAMEMAQASLGDSVTSVRLVRS